LSLSDPIFPASRSSARAVAWCQDSDVSQVGKAVELGKTDFLHFDAETVLQPLGSQVTVAPHFAFVAIVCVFPTEHDWIVAKAK
jgi:hypothetical protein